MLSLIAILLAFSDFSKSANIDNALEYAIHFPKPDTTFDIKWTSEVPSFYIPFLSKYDLLYQAKFFLSPGDFEKQDEVSMAKEHCVYFNFNRNRSLISINGFGGGQLNAPVKIDDGFPARWDYLRPDTYKIYGSSYVVLFDKENGLVLVSQWLNGIKSFALATPVGRKPTPEFINRIENMVENDYGFSPSKFVHSDYSGCFTPPSSMVKEEF